MLVNIPYMEHRGIETYMDTISDSVCIWKPMENMNQDKFGLTFGTNQRTRFDSADLVDYDDSLGKQKT